MLSVTQCIVLQRIRYGDHSLVIRCLSSEGGASFFISNMMTRGKNRYPFLSYPLAMVECTYLTRKGQSIPLVKSLSLQYVPSSAGFGFRQQALLAFMEEMTRRYIREENASPALYDFLCNSITLADSGHYPSIAFPYVFGFRLAALLGFGIGDEAMHGNKAAFRIDRGLCDGTVSGCDLDMHETAMLIEVMEHFPNHPIHKIPAETHRKIFQVMLAYFRFHIPEAGVLRTPEILHDLSESIRDME